MYIKCWQGWSQTNFVKLITFPECANYNLYLIELRNMQLPDNHIISEYMLTTTALNFLRDLWHSVQPLMWICINEKKKYLYWAKIKFSPSTDRLNWISRKYIFFTYNIPRTWNDKNNYRVTPNVYTKNNLGIISIKNVIYRKILKCMNKHRIDIHTCIRYMYKINGHEKTKLKDKIQTSYVDVTTMNINKNYIFFIYVYIFVKGKGLH